MIMWFPAITIMSGADKLIKQGDSTTLLHALTNRIEILKDKYSSNPLQLLNELQILGENIRSCINKYGHDALLFSDALETLQTEIRVIGETMPIRFASPSLPEDYKGKVKHKPISVDVIRKMAESPVPSASVNLYLLTDAFVPIDGSKCIRQ